MTLSDVVRQTTFEDAQNTFTSPSLIGPPTVEFAPYGRTPNGRRVDRHAGTIDQDPEFMAFLEGLANPTTIKELNSDAMIDGQSTKPEKVTTTPLVQYLKEKKAIKNKDAAAKAAKKQELQLAKGKHGKDTSNSSNSTEDGKKKAKDGKPDKSVEKAAKEAVKILNREATKAVPVGAPQGPGESSGTPKLDVSKVPERRKGAVIAAHIRMLQRDLGFSPAQAHRQVRRDTADAQRAERAAAQVAATDAKGEIVQTPQAPAIPTAPKASTTQVNRRAKGKGPEIETSRVPGPSGSTPTTASPQTPIVLLKKPDAPQAAPTSPAASQPAKPTSAAVSRKPPVAVPTEGATQAFVKHANPSQGVTEPLLKEAMEKFGAVSMVEIDKRKGFAYVEFVDSEGLKKAMAANPISVAQGTVHVMQRKGTALPPEKKPPHQAPHGPARGGRGGRGGPMARRGGRGGPRGGAAQAGPSEHAKLPAAPPTGPSAK